MTNVAKKNETQSWSPSSWRNFPITQVPKYQSQDDLERVRLQLSKNPPLVGSSEVRMLRRKLAEISEGKGFLFQGGDCAENFHADVDEIRDLLRLFIQSTVILIFAGKQNVTKIGRIAGQFAKPRSSDTETRDGVTLPSYRGDIINAEEFTSEARQPDPDRMLRAYNRSAAKLNYMRHLTTGGYVNLRNAENLLLDFVKNSAVTKEYEDLAKKISEAASFIYAMSDNPDMHDFQSTQIFTSHEALLLEYEEPLTRTDPLTNVSYDLSAHFLWVGDRTRDPDGAHVEFLSGVQNPIAFKCGPSLTPDDFKRLVAKLNPNNEAGRLTLISRQGAGNVEKNLTPFIRIVKEEGYKVVWCCDPMHGNIEKSESGYKTRRVENILAEIKEFFAVCQAEDVYPGGVHLEMTGLNVTECIGGFSDVSDTSLGENYSTLCDPRLNAAQAMQVAFEVSKLIAKDV